MHNGLWRNTIAKWLRSEVEGRTVKLLQLTLPAGTCCGRTARRGLHRLRLAGATGTGCLCRQAMKCIDRFMDHIPSNESG